MLRGLGAEASEVRARPDLEGLDGLVIPGGESTTIVKGIRAEGLEDPIRAHHEAGRAVLGTCAGMIVCDDDHLGLIDATGAAQRVRPPAAELRGRPRDRGDRRGPAAGGLHPRPVGRARRPRGRGPRRVRRSPGRDPRRRGARHRVPPGADRRFPAARTVHGDHDRSAEARARGGKELRDPRAERLAKILVGYSTKVKEGEVVAIDGDSAAEPLLLAVYEEVLKAGGNPIMNVALGGQTRRLLQARQRRPARLDLAGRRVAARERRRPDRDRRLDQHPRALGGPARAPDPPPGGDRRRCSRGRWSAARRASSAGSTRCSRPTPTPPRPR